MLVNSGALADHDAILEEFRQAHHLQYTRLHRLRLHRLWTGLHLGLAAYGIVLVVVTLLVH